MKVSEVAISLLVSCLCWWKISSLIITHHDPMHRRQSLNIHSSSISRFSNNRQQTRLILSHCSSVSDDNDNRNKDIEIQWPKREWRYDDENRAEEVASVTAESVSSYFADNESNESNDRINENYVDFDRDSEVSNRNPTTDETDQIGLSLENVKEQYQKQFSRLRDREYRRHMYRTIQTGFFSVIRHIAQNIREGEVGKRGEEWVFAQFFLLFSILFGVHPIFRWFMTLVGILSTLSGIYFISHAVSDLGELTTPFLSPVKASVVVENGVYRLVRHPMYGGLLLFCGGFSIIAGGVDKMVFTLALAWILNKKADLEEELLLRRHGENYVTYMVDKKKLIPLFF